MQNQDIFDSHSPLELAENLEQLLYGWLYYGSKSGMQPQELLKPYEAGRAIINQLILLSAVELTQTAA